MLCFTHFLLSLHKNSTDMKHLDIKRALDIKGLTIKELAERLSVTYNGARLLVVNAQTLASLEKVASAIGIDITDLFFSDEENSNKEENKPISFSCPYCGKPLNLHINK